MSIRDLRVINLKPSLALNFRILSKLIFNKLLFIVDEQNRVLLRKTLHIDLQKSFCHSC